ncbi:uncharacterized protein A4U43_C03F16740 [Asparagus officinalis]|uniref:Transmembrane 9 superfamily member n=1 Tax=Asparagus officinalis TaxID=4686 RepID=A0A5P1FAN1_ASPOF|nr:transmembrane 9 superfamily member 12-like [Asparagus officinalis]ONK75428.1 uncharacterized protein A4U43_C03F16740 [Asparagus officinalis]
MAPSLILLLILFLILRPPLCRAINFLGSDQLSYSHDEHIYAKVNSLTSRATLLPRDYYSLPFCKPDSGLIAKSNKMNLGQHLLGEKIQSSPYRFRINTNESLYLCTLTKLTKQSVEPWTKKTDKFYHANVVLDDLPVLRSPGQNWMQLQSIGYPVAYHGFPFYVYYVINHLKFRVFVHETRIRDQPYYEIVRFEVSPCSIKRDSDAMSKLNMYDKVPSTDCVLPRDDRQEIKEDEIIAFTYEVEFITSNITSESQWEAYVEKTSVDHYLSSAINSIITIILPFIVARFKSWRNKAKVREEEGVSRSKLFLEVGFRKSRCSKILSIAVGNGIHIAGMAILALFFAAPGLILPSSSGVFLTIAIVLYVLFGILGGYITVWMWSHIKGKSKGWVSVCWATSCFFFSILFAVFSVTNIIYYVNTSTAAVSFSVYCTLLALWLFISVPLTFLGGLTSTRSISNELRTEHKRRTPVSLFGTMTVILLSGFITHGSISTELANIFYCTWGGRSYCDLQHTLVITQFIVIACVSVSGWEGYMCIIADDWNCMGMESILCFRL